MSKLHFIKKSQKWNKTKSEDENYQWEQYLNNSEKKKTLAKYIISEFERNLLTDVKKRLSLQLWTFFDFFIFFLNHL